jgi:GH15 family glucan-1,4-alpha-glucosidase
MSNDARENGYLPIAGYGIIGDCRSVALVGVDGGVDWCCLPRADSPSVFARILDSRRGGSWQIAPATAFSSWQRYSEKTNILLTIFETASGRAEVADFMPIDERTIEEHARPNDRPRLIRVVRGLAGNVRFRSRVELRPDYARLADPLRSSGGRLHGDAGGHHFCISATIPVGDHEQEFEVGPGEGVGFGLTVNQPGQCGAGVGAIEDVRAKLRESREFWRTWAGRCNYAGPFQDHVVRSALVLKLMTYAPTGALIAAPTTSLPEWIGGSRNWDYRFTWLRDASFTLYAFFQLGYDHEARAFMDWLTRLTLGRNIRNLRTLDGGKGAPERELVHLDGYCGSRPVRVGNAAADQLQLDVYGELLDCAFLYSLRGGRISRELWAELSHLADLAADRWRDPDASIWEVRGEAQDFTYSKVMCWVALDRAIKIARRTGWAQNTERWESARHAVHTAVTNRAWSDRLGSFTRAFGVESLDASLLRLPQVGFLLPDDPRLLGTIKAVDRLLSVGPLVRRYDIKSSRDGLTGSEGSFVMGAFWLADALANVGELEEAERRFERLLSFASPLGLFSEEVDTRTGILLGNYPQAFSHLALVAAAVNIERQRHHALGQRARD